MRSFPCKEFVQTLHLCHPHGSAQIAQPIVVTHFIVHEVEGITARRGREMLAMARAVRVTTNNHPTATRGDHFISIETEAADLAQGPHSLSMVPRAPLQ